MLSFSGLLLVLVVATVAAVIVAVVLRPYVTLNGFINQPRQQYDYIIGECTRWPVCVCLGVQTRLDLPKLT